jgi:hypothetical protein
MKRHVDATARPNEGREREDENSRKISCLWLPIFFGCEVTVNGGNPNVIKFIILPVINNVLMKI